MKSGIQELISQGGSSTLQNSSWKKTRSQAGSSSKDLGFNNVCQTVQLTEGLKASALPGEHRQLVVAGAMRSHRPHWESPCSHNPPTKFIWAT